MRPLDRLHQYRHSGNEITFHFCPSCGATLYWRIAALPDDLIVATGTFADPKFPAPCHSVYKSRVHYWSRVPSGSHVEHLD